MCSYGRFWCGELSPELLIVHLHLFFQKVLVQRIGSRTVYSPFTFVLLEGSGAESWVQNCLKSIYTCTSGRFWCRELVPELFVVHLHLFFWKVLVRRIGSRTVYSPFTFVLPEGSGAESWAQNCL